MRQEGWDISRLVFADDDSREIGYNQCRTVGRMRLSGADRHMSGNDRQVTVE